MYLTKSKQNKDLVATPIKTKSTNTFSILTKTIVGLSMP